MWTPFDWILKPPKRDISKYRAGRKSIAIKIINMRTFAMRQFGIHPEDVERTLLSISNEYNTPIMGITTDGKKVAISAQIAMDYIEKLLTVYLIVEKRLAVCMIQSSENTRVFTTMRVIRNMLDEEEE